MCNIVVVGETRSFGDWNGDFMMVKTNSAGVDQWTKSYGGAGYDTAYSVLEHSLDNGLVLAGSTTSYGAGSSDHFLLKTDSVGVLLWAKSYGGSNAGFCQSAIEHSIGQALVLVGDSNNFLSGGSSVMLIVQPSDGSGALRGLGADEAAVPPAVAITTLTSTVTSGYVTAETVTEVDRSATAVYQPADNNVVVGSASLSRSPSQTPSQTPSNSASSSRTSSSSQTASSSRYVSCIYCIVCACLLYSVCSLVYIWYIVSYARGSHVHAHLHTNNSMLLCIVCYVYAHTHLLDHPP
jgi:hypothetical protein